MCIDVDPCAGGWPPSYAVGEAMDKPPEFETVSELASEILERSQRIVELEIALARAEAREFAVANGMAAGLLAGAGLLAMLTLLVALPVLLVFLLPLWLGWPSWTVVAGWIGVYLVAAAVLALVGRSKLRTEMPKRTLTNLKETREWVRHLVTSRGR